MNGEKLLEAMNYVDEQYVDAAEHAHPRRGIRWQSLAAAAACFCLLLVAYRQLGGSHMKESADKSQRTAEYAAIKEDVDEVFLAAGNSVAPQLAPAVESAISNQATVCMTVHLDEQRDGILICTVTDPGTGAFPAGAQVKILPPETESACSTADVSQMQLLVTFVPTDEDVIRAIALENAD